MNDLKRKSNSVELRFVSMHMTSKIILFLCALILFIVVVPASAEVFISDHFDTQSDWVGHDGSCVDPPSPWGGYGYYCSNNIHISSLDDAHGSGKCLWMAWGQSMDEMALMTPMRPTALINGQQELWIGYWFRHGTWNWGGDTTYKWFYGPQSGGGRMMINYDKYHRAYWNGKTHLQSNVAFTTTDTDWHSVIIYLKHNTNAAYDGEIRLWWDGVEATWSAVGDYASNTTLRFDSASQTGWDSSFMAFGFQSRPDWGPGNISYFDDIIVASTKEEVENFLGAGGPIEPTNSAPQANAGNDQTLTDTDGNGSELVNLDGTGSYDEDGSISSYQWKEGSTILSTEPKPQLNLGVGIHTITLVVTDNEGAQGSDSVTVSIQEHSQPPPSETVLMQEFFNDNALADRGWYDAGATSQKVVYDTERASNVLEIVYQNGATIPEGGSMRHLFDETDTIYFKYHIKYSENWSWTGVDYGPHEFYFLTNADHDWKGPAYSHLTFYVETVNGVPSMSIQDGMNVDTNHINEDLSNVTENRAAAGCNGNTDGYSTICYESGGNWYNGKKWRPEISAIYNNRWYEVSVFVKLNSIVDGKGASDGQLKYWLDGQPVLDLNDILFRTGAQPNLKFKHILFGPYFHNGVPHDQKFWIDDVVIKTGIDDSGPSAPTGLKTF